MKKWKLDRIFSIVTVVSSVITLVMVLKKPQPISHPMPVAEAETKAQSFQQKLLQFSEPKQPGEAPADLRLTSDEVSAAIAQANGAIPSTPITTSSGVTYSVITSPNAPIAPGQPDIKDYQVSFDGDVARGQFLTQIGGKDVYVTLAGHLGSKDGYATFDPTEFKLGDLNVPVSLVNEALQKKLTEQHDRLKLPDNIDGLKVENGELVLTQK